jgi:hypothetical protein
VRTAQSSYVRFYALVDTQYTPAAQAALSAWAARLEALQAERLARGWGLLRI